eukprot:TRINITY_DN3983_c0_g1_i2.p1 TRINITY_DN3983_c0_g1~~TRINITY_DN3983_c0_g1_i2.p1  ORF type:complete len:239 (-),score=31.20 TRINITY_DN3983_c0_g1_i2:49-765(-)
MYAVLMAGTRLVNLVRPKDGAIYPSDLLVLINFVNSSSTFRDSETWTPICLPKFNDQGFLYAYVCYLDEITCLILITTDSNDFHNLSLYKDYIHWELATGGELAAIRSAYDDHFVNLKDLDICVPELRHFLYKSEVSSQFILSSCPAPYSNYHAQKALFRRYQHAHAKINQARRRHTIYYEVGSEDSLLAWVRPGEFEMYAAFTPLTHKQQAITAANRVLRWIKREENHLFILNAPTW